MSRFKAAVIIPSRGGVSKLHFPLDALEQQTEKNFQVIVVIDGDIDNSAAVVEKYKERNNLAIECIVFPENRGRTQALNAGHFAADADVLIRCDDDLQPEPYFIEQHLSHYLDGEEVGVIGIYKNIFPETPYARAYGRYRDICFREDAYSVDPHHAWKYWAGNVSMSRELFTKIGGYDERYRLYGWEDVDMGYMAYKAGAKIVIDPKLETNHYVAATTSAGRATRALHSGAARDIFVQKHGNKAIGNPNLVGLWGLAVKSLSYILTEPRITMLGKSLDRIVDRLPHSISEKLVSLLVESSSYAGIVYPARAQKVF